MNERQFNTIVECLTTAVDKDGKTLKMDSIILSSPDATFAHYFTAADNKNDVRSLSKPIVGLALGIGIANGLTLRGVPLGLDTRIWPFFENRVAVTEEANRRWLGKLTLRHLLTHTTGHEIGHLFSKDVQSRDPDKLLEYIFNAPITHEPGTFFVYSNAGPYVISAMLQEELGMNLADWVAQLLLTPLGITDFKWRNYGKYCAASSGLQISNKDVHKIGRLLAQHGVYEGRQLVPRAWVEEMQKAQVLTPSMYDAKRAFPKHAYGYYLWICEDGSYYCDGTDGQYLIVLPRWRMVITTFGHQPDMKPITECFRALKETG